MSAAYQSTISRLLTPDQKSIGWQGYLFLVILSLAFFVQGFATLPPTDRDESLFAQASKQMVETQNYVDIRFQDQARYKKPVGIYWLQAAAEKLFNPSHPNEIWSYRLPSLASAVIAVVMTAAIGNLLFGPMEGLLAAVMMAGCVILNVEARLAKTDATLLASIVIAQYGLARAYLGAASKVPLSIFFVFWTAVAVGILIKGPIILLVLASTLLWLRVAEKNLAFMRRLRPGFGLLYTFLLITPWFVAIMLASHGSFITQSAGHDMLGKMWQDQGRGFIPPGAYLLALSVTFFPFGLFALLSIPNSWKNRQRREIRFCLGWIVPAWIVFELVLAKLPHYTMPLYPPIAILTAVSLLEGFSALASAKFRWLPPVAIALSFMAATALALGAVIIGFLNERWDPYQLAASLILLSSTGASLFLLIKDPIKPLCLMTAASLCFLAVLFGHTLPGLKHFWLSRDIYAVASRISPCAPRITLISSYHEPSLVFLAGTETKLSNDGAEIGRALQDNKCLIAVVNQKSQDAFLASFERATAKPRLAAVIQGFNIARSTNEPLWLYLSPQAGQ